MIIKNNLDNRQLSVGVDIGGTKIAAGLVRDGELLQRETVATPTTDNREEIIEAIFSVINKVACKPIAGIGIGVPGLVDTKAGIAFDIQNIPALTGVLLKEILKKYLRTPIFVNNDANCFALGAKYFGNGKKYQNLIGLTLGTGLGGGIVINGKLYEGIGCGAGEFGFLPYKDGLLEHYCSGQFFQRQYHVSGKEAAAQVLQGEKDAIQMFHQFGYHLGKAIEMVVHVFAPEAIVLGGSISRSFPLFEKSMWNEIKNFPYDHVIDSLDVFPIDNPDISLIGAASLVKN